MEAQGGGDGPESVSCAFKDALDIDWRDEAVKIIVWIADAPPHGLVTSGDGFPNGCPCGHDIIGIVKEMEQKEIIIYPVAAEPLGFTHLRNLMRAFAEITGGEFCALASANVLGDVIISGAQETIELQRITDEVMDQLKDDIIFKQMNEDERKLKIEELVNEKTKGKDVTSMEIESVFNEELPPIPEIFLNAQNLTELRNAIVDVPDSHVTMKAKFMGGGRYGGISDRYLGAKSKRRCSGKSAAAEDGISLDDDLDDDFELSAKQRVKYEKKGVSSKQSYKMAHWATTRSKRPDYY